MTCSITSQLQYIISIPTPYWTDFPQVILDIERLELGISAGLQDRVVQTFGGLVHMDFSQQQHGDKESSNSGGSGGSGDGGSSPYTQLDSNLLPEMYLAYDAHAGVCGLCTVQ